MNLTRSCFFLKGDIPVLLISVSTCPNIWDLSQKILLNIKVAQIPKYWGTRNGVFYIALKKYI